MERVTSSQGDDDGPFSVRGLRCGPGDYVGRNSRKYGISYSCLPKFHYNMLISMCKCSSINEGSNELIIATN